MVYKELVISLFFASCWLPHSSALDFVFENEAGTKQVNEAKILLDWCVNEIYHYQDTTRYYMEENARNVSRYFEAANTSIGETKRYTNSIQKGFHISIQNIALQAL